MFLFLHSWFYEYKLNAITIVRKFITIFWSTRTNQGKAEKYKITILCPTGFNCFGSWSTTELLIAACVLFVWNSTMKWMGEATFWRPYTSKGPNATESVGRCLLSSKQCCDCRDLWRCIAKFRKFFQYNHSYLNSRKENLTLFLTALRLNMNPSK